MPVDIYLPGCAVRPEAIISAVDKLLENLKKEKRREPKMHEEEIIESLCNKFPFLNCRIYLQKEKRIITKPLLREEFKEVIRFAHDELGFYRASHVVGTDDGENLGLLYILSDHENILLALRRVYLKQILLSKVYRTCICQ